MPVPIYMDVHVPAAISDALRRRGCDVLTSQEDGTDRLTDEQLLQRAFELQRIIFTQDNDFVVLQSRWAEQAKPSSGVIYAHQLTAGIGTLVQDLQIVLSCCQADELANRVTYLPLR